MWERKIQKIVKKDGKKFVSSEKGCTFALAFGKARCPDLLREAAGPAAGAAKERDL